MKTTVHASALLALATLVGCASYPPGPSMMVLPGTNASFDQFRSDELSCKVYADNALGGQSVTQTASANAVDNAAVGTAVGAAAGALIGAASGNPGAGAAIGGGTGLLVGSAAGADAYALGGMRSQSVYDNAYVQCMYARGHQVPVPASIATAHHSATLAPTAPRVPPGAGVPTAAAYPPPGTAPPPGY